MGTAHAEVVLDRLRVRHGLCISTPEVRVPAQATLRRAVTVTGRHVKQSGGHGQYAVVVLEVSPGAPGSGVVFSQRVVGGSVPGAYHGSVEKGVRTQAATGVDGSGPLVDLDVVLVDGKAHSVDSSDAAFQAAGALAVREAVAAAGTVALEPWCEVAVTVPTAFVGSVMSDLSGRRARSPATTPTREDDERSVVRAALPEVELLDLRHRPARRLARHGQLHAAPARASSRRPAGAERSGLRPRTRPGRAARGCRGAAAAAPWCARRPA